MTSWSAWPITRSRALTTSSISSPTGRSASRPRRRCCAAPSCSNAPRFRLSSRTRSEIPSPLAGEGQGGGLAFYYGVDRIAGRDAQTGNLTVGGRWPPPDPRSYDLIAIRCRLVLLGEFHLG